MKARFMARGYDEAIIQEQMDLALNHTKTPGIPTTKPPKKSRYGKYTVCQSVHPTNESNLKLKLQKLGCHFTWEIQEKDFDVEELEERLDGQLVYLDLDSKSRVYNLLAYTKSLKNNYQEAVSDLQKAEETLKELNLLETHRKYLLTYSNFAWVYHCINDYEMSKVYIDKIEAIYQDSKEYQDLVLSEITGEQGWALVNCGGNYYEKAKECFEEALKGNPDDPEWNSGYATIVYRLEIFRGRNHPNYKIFSFQLLKRAVMLNPKDSVIKALFALKLQELKKYEEAQNCIDDALQQSPDVPYVLRYAAKFYRRAQMFVDAISVLKKAVSITPNSGFLHHQLGLCYREMMKQRKRQARYLGSNQEENKEIRELAEKSIFHFEVVLEVKRSFLHAHFDLADMYIMFDQLEKAEETYKKALELTTIPDHERQQVHLQYGIFLENVMRCKDRAVIQYKMCLLIPDQTKYRHRCEIYLKRIAKEKRDPADHCLLVVINLRRRDN
ncbi:hypothetical protein GDO86_013241 [Hymenochirus boettgeri]|uniref:Uncharacterized protein n=1 Tax=Hymenochirus boettgeri TaxID=247094 RepID=A0A8T2IVZ8_9PIPI|nr:hypothetical protein GDO86_013241 [Hymenochirus boettgeri]